MTRIDESSHGAVIHALHELESREDSLLDQVMHEVRTNFPSYADVTTATIRSSLRQNIEMCAQSLLGPRRPSTAELRQWAQIARHRFESGVPIDDLIRSYTFSMGLIADTLTELCIRRDVPLEDVLAGSRALRQVADEYTTVLAADYREHRLQQDTQTHELKMDVLLRLRTGDVGDPRLHTALNRFGLRLDRRYRAFSAHLTDDRFQTDGEPIAPFGPCPRGGFGTDIYALMARIDSHLVGGRGIGVAENNGVIGITSEPFSPMSGVSVAYGHEVELRSISASFNLAAQVATTSIAREEGAHTLETADWRVAVDESSLALDRLGERFVEPLRETKARGEVILDSVRAFLLHDRSYQDASAYLHCHPNTLRYRLSRFETLTGESLTSTDCIVALSLMFEARSRG